MLFACARRGQQTHGRHEQPGLAANLRIFSCLLPLFFVKQEKKQSQSQLSSTACCADTEDEAGATGGGWDVSSCSGGAHTEHSDLAVQRLCASTGRQNFSRATSLGAPNARAPLRRRVAASHGTADGFVGHGTRARYNSSFRFMPCPLPSPSGTYVRDQEPCGRAPWRVL